MEKDIWFIDHFRNSISAGTIDEDDCKTYTDSEGTVMEYYLVKLTGIVCWPQSVLVTDIFNSYEEARKETERMFMREKANVLLGYKPFTKEN